MTVTNAAATVVRNPETGIKSPTLDLGLDSIVLLKRQGKFSIKNIASASSFREWLGSSQFATHHVFNIEFGLRKLLSGLQDSRLLQPVFQN